MRQKDFREKQRMVKLTVDSAKEARICKVAREAEAAVRDSQCK